MAPVGTTGKAPIIPVREGYLLGSLIKTKTKAPSSGG